MSRVDICRKPNDAYETPCFFFAVFFFLFLFTLPVVFRLSKTVLLKTS